MGKGGGEGGAGGGEKGRRIACIRVPVLEGLHRVVFEIAGSGLSSALLGVLELERLEVGDEGLMLWKIG